MVHRGQGAHYFYTGCKLARAPNKCMWKCARRIVVRRRRRGVRVYAARFCISCRIVLLLYIRHIEWKSSPFVVVDLYPFSPLNIEMIALRCCRASQSRSFDFHKLIQRMHLRIWYHQVTQQGCIYSFHIYNFYMCRHLVQSIATSISLLIFF